MQYLVLLCLPVAALSFTVLPYIQIDYAHYFRLAQCQAKCTEKYGLASKRDLLDGTIEEFFENNSEDGKLCELGCQQHRRTHRKHTRSTKEPLHDGARFWKESSADSANSGTSPVSTVELLCQNPSIVNEMEETAEGLVGMRLIRPSGAVRYIVQWKQRTYALGFYDETQWITASIESSTVFKVDGFIPGVQYRFMITVVGPTGRLGDTITSEWAEISGAAQLKVPNGPLTAKNGFNSEQGATSQLHWPRNAYDSCKYRLQYSNSTHHIEKDFTVDPSVSVLLTHLEFDSSYTASISAISTQKDESAPTVSKAISTEFNSFQCSKVYGRGSLNCAPEPVDNLMIVVRPNGTSTVSWKPSADVEAVLTYQLFYQSVTNSADCQTEPTEIYLNAASSSVEIDLSGGRCEYLVRLVNYDLLGRDAVAETRVSVESPLLPSFIQWEFVLIALCVTLICIICILLRCSLSKKCPVRVSEKSAKLTDSYA